MVYSSLYRIFIYINSDLMATISIITINYNDARGLEKTIQSVVSQKRINFEYIVIDGGSTDNSVEVIKRYANYINYWVSECDKGIYEAMNKGVNVAHGDYCLMLNSGDELFNSHVLSSVLPYLGSKEDFIVGKELMTVKGKARYLWCPPKRCGKQYLLKNSLRHQATFIFRELLIKEPFDEGLRLVSDWKQMLCAFVYHQATYKPIPVIVDKCERIGATFNNKSRSLEERQKVIREICPKSNITVKNHASHWYGLLYLRLCHLRGFILAKIAEKKNR